MMTIIITIIISCVMWGAIWLSAVGHFAGRLLAYIYIQHLDVFMCHFFSSTRQRASHVDIHIHMVHTYHVYILLSYMSSHIELSSAMSLGTI